MNICFICCNLFYFVCVYNGLDGMFMIFLIGESCFFEVLLLISCDFIGIVILIYKVEDKK